MFETEDIDPTNHLIYVSSPYTHSDKKIEEERFEKVEEFTARLLKEGYFAYSPIVHCHALSRKYKLPTDAKYWENYNLAFLKRCSHLIVLTVEGWTKSKGIAYEIKIAKILAKPISYEEIDNDSPT
jgi:hypothetical protein